MKQAFGEWLGNDPMAPFLVAVVVIEVAVFVIAVWGVWFR